MVGVWPVCLFPWAPTTFCGHGWSPKDPSGVASLEPQIDRKEDPDYVLESCATICLGTAPKGIFPELGACPSGQDISLLPAPKLSKSKLGNILANGQDI